MKLQSRVWAATLVAISPFLGIAWAQTSPFDVDRLTQYELIRLPEYCLDSQGYIERLGRPPEGKAKWFAMMGQTFIHIHHYCYGLLKAMRAESAPSIQLRQSLFRSAIHECEYVVRRAPPAFPLLPEILLRMGQYSAALGNAADAVIYFERSRSAKRDYWPAYLEAAKLETTLRRHDRARLLIEEGLREAPDQPALLEARDGIKGR